jgi:outer membrane cobalamin receptor
MLSANYSMRVQRPRAEDLNPFLVYIDPFNFRQGNPNLRPQKTNSFELGYQHRRQGSFYQATLYYRQASGGITDVVRDLGGGVTLTTRENLRRSQSGGLELVANGRLTPKITYNASTNIAWNQIDASTAGVVGTRDAYTVSGRANVNWQVTPKDFLQANLFATGKRLTAQGYSTGFTSVNLGYRHRFNDKWSGVVTAQDIFNTSNVRQVYDTPTLSGTSEREFTRRGVYVGLVWTFGGQQQQGRRQQDPGFEFGGGGEEGAGGGGF